MINKKTKNQTKKTGISKIKKTPQPSKNHFLSHKSRYVFLSLLILFAGVCVFLFHDLPSPGRLTDPQQFPASTLIYDRNGKLLYEIFAEKNRVPVTLDQLPEHLKKATIAAEDKNFYSHHGFDFGGIFRAAFNILFHRSLQGGSTLTQQLVKTALLNPERTLKRKIREAVLTIVTEVVYSKDQILEMYLNQAPYGGTAWGIETASRKYFGIPAKELTLSQSALLAGLTASPTRYSPFGAHPELAKDRQILVLNLMVEQGFITSQQAEAAKQEELVFALPGNNIEAPHFVLYVKDQLVEKFGEMTVEQGGLKVTTTLDLDLQNFAQQTVASEVAKLTKAKISNGAAMVTNPESGEILAMVGSKDYFDQAIDGNVNVTLALRQPGSSIKPLNYALGIENRLITPSTVLVDVPTCFSVTGQKNYCPVNYDGSFHGPVQVRFALGNSYNIPAVKTLTLNGLENFIDKCREMGITTFTDPSRYGLSLTLGGGEVKMIDMATAFSAFPNLGIKKETFAIKTVVGSDGKTLYQQQEAEERRVLSMETAYLINHILLDNSARSGAFGTSSYLVIKDHPEVSVKTGTTNDMRDNWTIGWNPTRLILVWVGNNDNSPMSYVASGVTGASPIWNKIISYSLRDTKQEWPIKPEGIIGTSVCTLSGLRPNPDFPCQTRYEYFIKDALPGIETGKTSIGVDKTTGSLSNSKTPPENIEMQEHQLIGDPLDTYYCVDCQQPISLEPQQINPSLIIPKLINSALEPNDIDENSPTP